MVIELQALQGDVGREVGRFASRELERRLSPEFRNRLDDVIVFAPLTRDEVRRITRMQLDHIIETATARGKSIEITEEAVDALVSEGFSMAYGARYLKRVIDDRVKIPLSQMWGAADAFRVTARDNAVVVEALPSILAEPLSC